METHKRSHKINWLVVNVLIFIIYITLNIPSLCQTLNHFEYFVPLKFPDKIYSASDFGDYLTFVGFYDNTTVQIDKEADGIVDKTFILNKGLSFRIGRDYKGSYGSIDFQQGTQIISDRPILIRYFHFNNDYGCYDDYMSTYTLLPTSLWDKEFYIPLVGLGVNVVACFDNTIIEMDIDNNGTIDTAENLSKAQVSELRNIINGTHILSNKPVSLVAFHYNPQNKDDFWTYEVLPFSMQCKEYYAPQSAWSQSQLIILATESLTEVQIDVDANGSFDQIEYMDKNEMFHLQNLSTGAHILANNKVCVLYKNDRYLQDPWRSIYRHYAWAYMLFPVDHEKFSFFNEYLLGTVPWSPNKVTTISLSNQNLISVDLGNDGSIDLSNSVNKGQSWEFNSPENTNVVGNDPFLLASFGEISSPIEQVHLDGHLHYPIAEEFYTSFLQVNIDYIPQHCPNILNINNMALVPVAILGTENFDVTSIDLESIKLEGASHVSRRNHKPTIIDVSTPVGGDVCDCTEEGPDGFDDYVFFFDQRELAAALGDVKIGDEVVLTLSGQLNNGSSIQGQDCVTIWASGFAFGKDKGDKQEKLPENFMLMQNYPNPFNPKTEVSFVLPEESDITLSIYNTSGQLIRILVSGHFGKGAHRIIWNATDDNGSRVASGIYLVVLKAEDFVAKNKLILTK